MIMENREKELIDRIFIFCKELGLPTTFKEMGLKNINDQTLRVVAKDEAKNIIIKFMLDAYANPDSEGNFYNSDKRFRCMKETDIRGQALKKGE